MEYKQITGVRLPVSRIVFGTAIPSMMQGENAFRLLDAAFEEGINAFDLARSYGLAEKSMGAWMDARGNRDRLTLLTKGAHPVSGSMASRVTPEAVRQDAEESLRALHTDFIDVYLLHRDCPKAPVGPLVETLNELREEGKIGIFGGSNWSYGRIDEANEYAYAHDLFGFEASSPAFSLAEQVEDPWGGGCVDISGDRHLRDRSWYQEEGIAVFAYASLAHGFLSGKFRSDEERRALKVLDAFAVRGYCCAENFERLRRAEELAEKKRATVPQIALAYVLSQPFSPMAVCAASSVKKMQSNVKALQVTLTKEELRWLGCSNIGLNSER